ncbi:hypothetical protein [Macrococcus capreoli]|uniref:hypothetical protein n=1 Tax=Macrococcus capreoli TaxID=2982690 RepID=UPI003EE45707
MDEKQDRITKREISSALNSSFKRNKKEAERIVDEKFNVLKDMIVNNSNDVSDLKNRLHKVETMVYPLVESVDNIKKDVSEIKSDIKEGFKELKSDFKDYKIDIKTEIKNVAEDVENVSNYNKQLEKRIESAEVARGFLGFLKSTEGIVVSIIGVTGPIIITVIQIFSK